MARGNFIDTLIFFVRFHRNLLLGKIVKRHLDDLEYEFQDLDHD